MYTENILNVNSHILHMELNTEPGPMYDNINELHIIITFTIWNILNSIQPESVPYENYGNWIII